MRQIDTRESNFDEIVQPLIMTGWERQMLYSGDFRFNSIDGLNIGSTRKTMSDYLNSIGDTFSGQLEEMLAEYDICIFILEDCPTVEYDVINDELIIPLYDKVIRFNRLSASNYLHRWQSKGFALERTRNPQMTVRRLNELYTLYQKPYSTSGHSRRFGDDRINALPSGLKGKKGINLLASHSLFELASFTIPDWLSVDGIGDKLATRAFQHFHRR